MKAVFNSQITIRVLATIAVLAFMGCGNGDEPDLRDVYAGSFKVSDLVVFVSHGKQDTLFSLTQTPVIGFESAETLHPNELRIELMEFVSDLVKGTLGPVSPADISFYFDEEAFGKISGSSFELNHFRFELLATGGGNTATYPCELTGKGEMRGREINFEFDMTIFTNSFDYIFEGEAIAKRN